MSASEIPVHVAAGLATETFVLNHAFQLVYRAVGPFSTTLAPGLYKFKFRKGAELAELHYEVPNDPKGVQITSPLLHAASSAPLSGSRSPSPEQLSEAKNLSESAGLQRGQGSSIFLFVRTEGSTQSREATAAACLSLRRLNGEVMVDLASDGVLSQYGTSGLLVHVDPGSYVLHASCNEGPFEQVVVASPGWMTQLFFTCAGERSPRTDQTWAPALTLRLEDTSVLMSRGSFNPTDPMLELADAARVALGNQRVRMPRKLLSDLIWDKFDSPMLGIYAAHALYAAVERGDTPEGAADASSDRQLLAKVLNALEGLVPGHPDVAALSNRTEPRSVDAPPMLRSSWRAVVDATLDGTWKLEPNSLSARLPAAQMANTPWLIWSERALLSPSVPAPADTGGVLAALQQQVERLGIADFAPIEVELSDSEEAMYSFLKRRARLQQRSPAKASGEMTELGLAKALGASLPEVRQLVSTLASKLEPSK